jgi:hypothetical protein
VPTNYRLVQPNFVLHNWFGTSDYVELVSLAVDEAGGRAFVTEYAGTSAVVSGSGIALPSWDHEVFLEISATQAMDSLEDQGLYLCPDAGLCGPLHPQIQGILDKWLPVPEGVDEDEFYSCLSCFEGLIDMDAWSAPGFAADIEERIYAPARHALDMLEAPYLTRLFTMISPEEMTVDPIFHVNPDLGNVQLRWISTRHVACKGPDYIELFDGRQIVLEDGDYQVEGMPYAVWIAQAPAKGPLQIITDNNDWIDARIDAWNDPRRVGPDIGCKIQGVRAESVGWLVFLFGGIWIMCGRGRRRRR